MHRILSFSLAVAASVLLAACSSEEKLPEGSLTVEGVYNNRIVLGAESGSWKKFSITSKYEWEIPAGNGFYCTPDHGQAGKFDIVMTATETSSSIDNTTLGGLTIRVKSTKFIGITVYQEPILYIIGSHTLYTDAAGGSSVELMYSSGIEDTEAIADGDIRCERVETSGTSTEYSVTAKSDNYSMTERKIGVIRFKADGAALDGVVTVMQRKAISLSRETVLLGGHSGAETMIRVSSPFPVETSATGEGFTVSYDGAGVVTVRSTVANDTDRERTLGSVRIGVSGRSDCRTTVEVRQRPQTYQTLMFYFNGTALSSYFRTNREDVMKGTTRQMLEHNRILMFVQETPTYGNVYELSYGTTSGTITMDHLREFTLTPSYDVQNLKDILTFMTETAPAVRYGLTFSSHGKGWIPKSEERSRNRMSFIESMWRKAPGALDTRWVGDTVTYGYDTTELAEAISSVGITLEYLIFDTCFMGNIESIYDLRDAARYIMASPCEVMGKGLPYETIMKHLITDDGGFDLDAAAMASVDYYNTQASTKSCCLAVTECSKVEKVASALKEVNAAATREYDIADIQSYEGINPHVFYDLDDVYVHTCGDDAKYAAFREALDEAVTSRYHTEGFYSAYNGRINAITHYSGVSTSSLSKTYENSWKETAWYKATH